MVRGNVPCDSRAGSCVPCDNVREFANLRSKFSSPVRGTKDFAPTHACRSVSTLLAVPLSSCVSYIDLIPSGYWVLIVCGSLLLLTLYFLFRASTTDPGIFLRLPPEAGYKWHAISQEVMAGQGKAVQLRYCRQCHTVGHRHALLLSERLCECSRLLLSLSDDSRGVQYSSTATMCALYRLQQLRRELRSSSVHSLARNRALLIGFPDRMLTLPLFLCRHCLSPDCPWLGTCVGKGNYRSFFLFLTFLSLLNWSMQALCIYHLYRRTTLYKDWRNASDPSAPISGGAAFWHTLNTQAVTSFILVLYGFLFGFFTNTLYFFHVYLVARGVTTNEELKKTWPHGSPFSEGLCRNVINLMCRVPTRSRLKRAYKLNARTEMLAYEKSPPAAEGGAAAVETSPRQSQGSGLPAARSHHQQRRDYSAGSRGSHSSANSHLFAASSPGTLEPDLFAFHPLASSHRFHGLEMEAPAGDFANRRSSAAAGAASAGSAASAAAAAERHANWLSSKANPDLNWVVRVVDTEEMKRREAKFRAARAAAFPEEARAEAEARRAQQAEEDASRLHLMSSQTPPPIDASDAATAEPLPSADPQGPNPFPWLAPESSADGGAGAETPSHHPGQTPAGYAAAGMYSPAVGGGGAGGTTMARHHSLALRRRPSSDGPLVAGELGGDVAENSASRDSAEQDDEERGHERRDSHSPTPESAGRAAGGAHSNSASPRAVDVAVTNGYASPAATVAANGGRMNGHTHYPGSDDADAEAEDGDVIAEMKPTSRGHDDFAAEHEPAPTRARNVTVHFDPQDEKPASPAAAPVPTPNQPASLQPLPPAAAAPTPSTLSPPASSAVVFHDEESSPSPAAASHGAASTTDADSSTNRL